MIKMIEDLYQKVSDAKSGYKPSKEKGNECATKQDGCNDLSLLKKDQLLEVARSLNLKTNSKANKGDIINLISNHYGFVKLNEKISQRSKKGSGLEKSD